MIKIKVKVNASMILVDEPSTTSELPCRVEPGGLRSEFVAVVPVDKTMVAASKTTFHFGASCTIAQADVLRYALIGRLGSLKAKTFPIDLTEIDSADVSLLQILVSLRASAKARGVTIRASTNAFVDDLLARSGLARWNEDPG